MAINTSILKSYAPEARRNFIAAVKTRAARFGIVDGRSASIQEQGEVAIINGQAYPRTVARQCRDLEGKIHLRGFDSVMEEVAYTWFNRFAAIRYMELHGYLDHGFRVLSHPTGETTPEIVQHAEKVELPGLRADRVVELKLDGRKDEDLYRMLLVAQCNTLHAAMPFLFERINDETELLLPDNLLHSDSVIREMVDRIPEVDWQEIEIIGWLYQFYISEKKDQVIGKVVKSEDIPAATQLFTPNWIVKYMVQNSLGAKWLATYPDSPIKAKMEYYIGPAEQPGEVQRQIEAETPKSLDPEKLTFLDPASGSGHILVEAYDLFKEIYLERGYRLRDIPRLILEKNLHGLDIDDRAAQLAGFALLMRARADDRQLLSGPPVLLNLLALQESNGLNADSIATAVLPSSARFDLLPTGDLLPDTLAQPTLGIVEEPFNARETISGLVNLFTDAKTFGSLLSVPLALSDALPTLSMEPPAVSDGLLDLAAENSAKRILSSFVRQAEMLARSYDVVAANPPYMGMGAADKSLKAFLAANFPEGKIDLYSAFILRCFAFSRDKVSMVVQHSWMFLSRFEDLRRSILGSHRLLSIAHLGARAFESIGGEVVQSAIFAASTRPAGGYVPCFLDATAGNYAEKQNAVRQRAVRTYHQPQERFLGLPKAILAYWASEGALHAFESCKPLERLAKPRHGMATSNNARFLRVWSEVSWDRIALGCESREQSLASGGKWFPYNKGGGSRKWFGNNELVVNWEDDGKEIIELAKSLYGSPSRQIQNTAYYFRRGITWSSLSSADIAMRSNGVGFLFDSKGNSMFFDSEDELEVFLAICNSKPAASFMRMLAPTLDFNAGAVGQLPVPKLSADERVRLSSAAMKAVELSKQDWDRYETSWEFLASPFVQMRTSNRRIADCWVELQESLESAVHSLQSCERSINDVLIKSYGLEGELTSDVDAASLTLTANPYRLVDNTQDWLVTGAIKDLVSYAVGCMFGRYSLDEPGLILANQGDTLADYLAKVPNPSFVADADNIIPMLDDNWFEDDVTDRFLEFLRVTFGAEHFDENIAFVEKAIGKDIRKSFKRDFFSDHLKRYKRRPIYWVFSSGKERAFEAIVYMHRYNETTLARMRMNYVVPLQSQMANRIERLATELSGPNLSSAERKRKDTQRAKLIKQLEELGRFEEELRHLADQRIRIDLDDGVKVNYGKFGSLLAEVKAVTGGTDD